MDLVFHFPCLYLKIANKPVNNHVIQVVSQTPFKEIMGIIVNGLEKNILPIHSIIPLIKQNKVSPAPFNKFLVT
jgi:hypothetical protein